ncbi:hypothetical protein B0H67DRAFT_606737 [Lasiosphaeris hirsuta]|uniref:NACHT domain-containing protein n=1 Tax=Lasiosphaeris hirsuta TaxID=260670 RepID=A0AA40BDJ5_9PEZI|nr:hypothetical protein B0H67DRAFT_606737 [Lasiosphaeris hirsuta]
MDPFSAIGLAANITGLIEFGLLAVSIANQISQNGSTHRNAEIESLTSKSQSLADSLKSQMLASELSADRLRLQELAEECVRISEDMLRLLSQLTASGSRSNLHVIRLAWKNIRKKSEVAELEKRLGQARQTLHLQLSQISRFEVITKLNHLIQTGKCQQHELQSLGRHVERLEAYAAMKSLGPELSTDLQSIANVSSRAMDRVLQNIVLKGLRSPKMTERLNDIPEAHMETFDWILHSKAGGCGRMRDAADSFIKWLRSGQGFFHVSGKPGSGKSTLMKYIVENPTTERHLRAWAGTKKMVLSRHFFWKPGTALQKSLQGLAQSLLHSVLQKCPELIPTVLPKQWQMARDGHCAQFEYRDTQDALNAIIRQGELRGSHKFAFFIDGLDELEGDHDTLIRSLYSWVNANPSGIKICVSSRDWLIFRERFSRCPKLQLHELTAPDIAAFIEAMLEENEDFRARGDQEAIMALGSAVVQKSEGVFLWATLAMRTLEAGLLAEEEVEELAMKMDALPKELDQLFQAIFDSILERSNPIDRASALRTLGVISHLSRHEYFAVGPWDPPLLHISFLGDFERNDRFGEAKSLGQISRQDISQRLRRARKKVYHHCSGFVHVTKNENQYFRQERVTLVHRAVVKFLQKEEIRAHILHSVKDFDFLTFMFQSLLAEHQLYFGGPVARKDPERVDVLEEYYLDGSSWGPFEADLNVLFQIYLCGTTQDDLRLHHMLETIERLTRATIPKEFRTFLTVPIASSWNVAGGSKLTAEFRWELITWYCHPADIVCYVATGYGFLRYVRAKMATRSFVSARRHAGKFDSIDAILPFSLTSLFISPIEGLALPIPRLLSTLAIYFEMGGNPNCDLSRGGVFGGVSCAGTYWQICLWHAIIHGFGNISEFILKLFLLHGADSEFRLHFQQPPRRDGRFTGYVLVHGEFGADRTRPFDPIFLPDAPDGITGLARRRSGLVTLQELLDLGYPRQSQSFRDLIDRNTTSSNITAQQQTFVSSTQLLQELKAQYIYKDSQKLLTLDNHEPLILGWVTEHYFLDS